MVLKSSIKSNNTYDGDSQYIISIKNQHMNGIYRSVHIIADNLRIKPHFIECIVT